MTIKYSKQTSVLVIEGEQRDKVKESFIKAVGNRPDADTNSAEANEIQGIRFGYASSANR